MAAMGAKIEGEKAILSREANRLTITVSIRYFTTKHQDKGRHAGRAYAGEWVFATCVRPARVQCRRSAYIRTDAWAHAVLRIGD